MKKISENVIESFKNVQRQLKDVDFKRFLELQMKEYELTADFLKTFDDYIDIDVSKFIIDAEGIKYLISINKFNFDTWRNTNPYKSLDVLLDPSFAKHFTKIEIEEILQESKNISQAVMKRFINTVSQETKRDLLLNYFGPEFPGYFDAIVSCIPVLQQDLFCISKANEDIKKSDSKIISLIFDGGTEVSINLLLELLNRVYIPNKFRDSILNRTLRITNNINATFADYERARHNLINIFEKYPEKNSEELLLLVNYYDKRILLDKELLTQFLVECDNISETILSEISQVFISTGCKDKLLDYVKKNNYDHLQYMLAK